MIFKSIFINILQRILKSMNPIEATEIVNDEYAVRILLETLRHPSSMIDLSYKLGLPIAECSKRVKMLKRHELIHCMEIVLIKNGRLIRIYVADQRNTYTLLRNFSDELGDVISDLWETQEFLIDSY